MQIALRRNLTEEQAGLDAAFHLVRLDVVEHHRVLDGSVLDRADDRYVARARAGNLFCTGGSKSIYIEYTLYLV